MAKRDIPVFSSPLIETHCHLDYLETDDVRQTLEAANAVNIQRIITIAVSPDNLDTVLNLTEQHAMVWGTQGVHPHDAEAYDSLSTGAHIRKNAAHEKIVAIGEIGLDYYYDHADRAKQRQVFEEQLQLAAELELPIVVHTRSADEDTQAILKNQIAHLPKRGVIHSFTSGEALADYCLSEGFSLGFNGISTFNKAENVRDIVRMTPLDQLLFETDAPYLTPVPYRGRKNEPKYLPFVAEHVATLKALTPEELLPQVWQNSMRLFFEKETLAI